MSARVLVVEDEPRVQQFIVRGLAQAGMNVSAASNITTAFDLLPMGDFDVMVLDRLLGRDDSIAHVKELRAVSPQTRVIILSALHSTDQRVQGLDEGADDYLGKPFHIRELVSRIHCLNRRTSAAHSINSNSAEYLDLQVNHESQKVTRAGRSVTLSFQEFKILAQLIKSPKRVFSRMELLQSAWDMNFDPESNVVDVTVGRLRRKINAHGSIRLIHARRGVGYSLSEIESEESL